MKTITYFKTIILSVLALSISSCVKDGTDAFDNSVRVGLSPEPEQFAANGTTVSGDESFVGVVTVVKDNHKLSDNSWEAVIAEETDWATINRTIITSTFTETHSGKIHTVQEAGIEVKVQPNTEYRRAFTVEIRTADGSVTPFTFSQLGEKADAEVTTATKDVEFLAAGGSEEIVYTTNMGDVYSFEVEYGEEGAEWLSWSAERAGSVTLTAAAWTDKVHTRTATFTIVVGTDATSKASVSIPVVQLAADEYYFIYGTSCNGLTIDKALQLTKRDTGIYACDVYFMAADGGKNPILLNPDSRMLSYPYYALAADGTIAEIATAETVLPAGPAIDIDGRRNLIVNMNDKTWTWTRVTTVNCLPDSEVASYKTKSFIARDGSMKTWMVEFLRWDGGVIRPKLGSPMVATATGAGAAGTGGYAAANFPSSWDDTSRLNMAYETTEIGGQLVGTNEHGRIYAFSEIITGKPTAGVGIARYEPLPEGWTAGCEIVDAVGDRYVIEHIDNKNAATFSGDNAADEAAHPTLKMQIQGICPYGWHIANTADWLDIAYAAAKASAGHTFPIDESRVTYKQFSTVSGSTSSGDKPDAPRGIGNFAAWLRNTQYWSGSTMAVSDGADAFGFEYYPLGWRYMTQGFQCAGTRAQVWIPLFYSNTATFRVNVLINNAVTSAEMANFDNGQAIAPFRCVKNYKK